MKRRLVIVSAALSTLIAIACGGFHLLRASQQSADPGTPVRVIPLREPCATCGPRNSFEVYTGIEDKQRLVIRDREAWSKLWKRIYSLRSPTPPLPEIDFAKEMLVVAATGTQSNGGYGILIDGAGERDDRLEIKVHSISPGKGCMTTQALTAPVDIVRLPKSERTVVFREIEMVHNCE